MPRAGPKGTIPPPSERPQATHRWPLQVLAGTAIIGALFMMMRGLHESSPQRSTGPAADATRVTPAPVPGERSAGTPPPQVAAAGAEDAQFVAQLERSAARRSLRGTPYTADVADLVAQSEIADAAALLDARSAGGDHDATVVLLQLEMLCDADFTGRGAEAASNAGVLDSELVRAAPVPAELRRRIDTSRVLDSERRSRLRRACDDADFDERTTEDRVRRAAEAGHEASLWALGRYFDDAEQQRRHWLSAAMLGYPAAQVDLADSLLQESLQGDRRNRGQMNFWLAASAKHSPESKEKLGECVLNGCNAQPPDSEAAVPLLRDAALLGELSAFDALSSVSRADPAALSEEQLYGLQAFLQKLNDAGCYGPATYPVAALRSLRSLREIGSRLSPHTLQDAEELATAHWRDHGTAARRAQGCE